MRKLKDGTVKYKASSYKNYERLAGPSFPLPLFPVGTKVQVYLGAGFGTAYVVQSFQDRCIVRLANGNRNLTVYDARTIIRSDSNANPE